MPNKQTFIFDIDFFFSSIRMAKAKLEFRLEEDKQGLHKSEYNDSEHKKNTFQSSSEKYTQAEKNLKKIFIIK